MVKRTSDNSTWKSYRPVVIVVLVGECYSSRISSSHQSPAFVSPVSWGGLQINLKTINFNYTFVHDIDSFARL